MPRTRASLSDDDDDSTSDGDVARRRRRRRSHLAVAAAAAFSDDFVAVCSSVPHTVADEIMMVGYYDWI